MLFTCFGGDSSLYSLFFCFGVARKSILEFISHHLQIIIINQIRIHSSMTIISLLLSSLRWGESMWVILRIEFCEYLMPRLESFRTFRYFHPRGRRIMGSRWVTGGSRRGLCLCQGCWSLNHGESLRYFIRLGILQWRIRQKRVLFSSLCWVAPELAVSKAV